MAKNATMMKLYAFEDSRNPVKTVNGKIPYAIFLEREKERIEKSPGRVVQIKTVGSRYRKKMALFVNRIAE